MLEPRRDPERRDNQPSPRVFGNRLLDALPNAAGERLASALRRVFLQRDQIVMRPGEPVAFLHFPIDAFAWSWANTTQTQHPTSVMTVGQHGVLEWNRVLATERAQTCATIISPGSAWRLPIEVFELNEQHTNSPLRRLLLRYAGATILNIACRLACNAEHNIDQRLARWLLSIADECGRNDFTITHQQIAEVAAIRRPSVSLALSQFQRDGFVRSQHGRLQLLDRDALESIVCNCYRVMRENSDSVYGEGGF